MRDSVRCGLLLLLLMAHWSAQAQRIYMCKDASGRTITSDRPLPECAGRAVREYDRKGIPRRDVPAPPTAEQKQELQLQEEKRQVLELAAEEQKRRDRAIRFRYRNEGEIELARKRAVEGVQDQIKREMVVLAVAEKRLQGAQAVADSHRKKNEPVPAELQRGLSDTERTVRESKRLIADCEAEIVAINEKHDETVKRYRVVTGVAEVK
jgi:hypothetical protein